MKTMAKVSFTPGPWQAAADELIPERGAIYIFAKGKYDPREAIGEAYKTDADVDAGGVSETEANARLIAAAPELYDALKALEAEATRLGNALSARGQGATVLGLRCRAAREAIAKAEGDGNG